MKNMETIDNNGWNQYDGQNHQWYALKAKQLFDGILYCLDADNSGDCYGDYTTEWFFGGDNLMRRVGYRCSPGDEKAELAKLLGDMPENNKLIDAVLIDCGLV